jgi:hypothetical protein
MVDRMSLFASMITRQPVNLGNYSVVVNSIQAEDGSGWSFIVSGQIVGYAKSGTFHVRIKGSVSTVELVHA